MLYSLCPYPFVQGAGAGAGENQAELGIPVLFSCVGWVQRASRAEKQEEGVWEPGCCELWILQAFTVSPKKVSSTLWSSVVRWRGRALVSLISHISHHVNTLQKYRLLTEELINLCMLGEAATALQSAEIQKFIWVMSAWHLFYSPEVTSANFSLIENSWLVWKAWRLLSPATVTADLLLLLLLFSWQLLEGFKHPLVSWGIFTPLTGCGSRGREHPGRCWMEAIGSCMSVIMYLSVRKWFVYLQDVYFGELRLPCRIPSRRENGTLCEVGLSWYQHFSATQ